METSQLDLFTLATGEFTSLNREELDYIDTLFYLESPNEDSTEAVSNFKFWFDHKYQSGRTFPQNMDITLLHMLGTSVTASRLVPRLLATIKVMQNEINIQSLRK
jgi:hypothetical protein